jgi:hypothetical protein
MLYSDPGHAPDQNKLCTLCCQLLCIPCCQKLCTHVAKNCVFLIAKNCVLVITDYIFSTQSLSTAEKLALIVFY